MNGRQAYELCKNVDKWFHKNLAGKIGGMSVEIIHWDIETNQYKHASAQKKWLNEIYGAQLDKDSYKFLKEGAIVLDANNDINRRFKKITEFKNSVDTVITRCTPHGFDEIVVSTEKELTSHQIEITRYYMKTLMREFTKFTTTNNYIFPDLHAPQGVKAKHKMISLQDFKKEAEEQEYQFGDKIITKGELMYLRGSLYNYKICQFEQHGLSAKRITNIKKNLIKKFNVNNEQQMMKEAARYKILSWILEVIE